MSGSPAPLTTIFTPPAGCFETTATPDVWQTCYETRATTECYWSRPDECYPTLASAYKTNFPPTSTAENVVFRYSRSPGVLPSGYSTVTTFRDILNNPNLVLGCLSNYNLHGGDPIYCYSVGSGKYVSGSTTTTGAISILLPAIEVAWASAELSIFTPVSAPALPRSKISAYEASVAATAAPRSTLNGTHTKTPSTQNSHHQSQAHSVGMSTGAKAGIAVGVIIATALILIIGFLIIRNKRRRTASAATEKPAAASGIHPYLDSKAELASSNESQQRSLEEMPAAQSPRELHNSNREELHSDSVPQELATTSHEPPPIPLSSKPRFQQREGTASYELPS